jgi:ABC-type transport system substrate-binding protein
MRFMDPAKRSPYQFMMRNKLIGLDDLARSAKNGKLDYDVRIPGMEALDRYTVQFRLVTPDSTLVSLESLPPPCMRAESR